MSLAGLVALLGACGSAVAPTGPSGTASSSSAPAAASPTLAPSPTTATALVVDTSGWIRFDSRFYGFSVSHPVGWTAAPGSGGWSLANPADASEDTLTSPSGPPSPVGPPNLMAFEVKVPAGMSADAFIEAYTKVAHVSDCYPVRTQLPQTTIDGHAATVAYGGCVEQYYFAEAIAVIGDRIWIFSLHGPDRSLIVPFLSTVNIDPSKVVD